MGLKNPPNILGKFLTLLMLAGLGLTIYANSLNGQLIWDDHDYIGSNPLIRSVSNIPKIFQQNIAAASNNPLSSYYRPIQELTYLVDFQLYQFDLRGYHLTNILLHILVTLTLMVFIRTLTQNSRLATLTGLLFICHPIHTESVSYLAGRCALLAALFMLISLIFYLRALANNHSGNVMIFFFAFLCALLSKENAIVIPLLLIAYHYVYQKPITKVTSLPWIFALGGYVALRLSHPATSATAQLQLVDAGTRIAGFFHAIPIYLRLMILPADLHFDYGQPIFTWTNPGVLLGLGITASAIAFVITQRKKYPLQSFTILWFFITLLPYSNIVRIYTYLAEQNLYLPSMVFFLILGQIILRWRDQSAKPIILKVVIAALILTCSFLTLRQNVYSQDPILFYRRCLQYTQRDILYINLGTEYQRRGKINQAIEAYQNAIRLNPGSIRAQQLLTQLCASQKSFIQANP